MIACYCRVSTEEQVKEGLSIDEQQNRLKAYCVSQGWDDYAFYIDAGWSAKNTKRPQIQALLSHITQGKIKRVLVTKIDRLTRSLFDMCDLIKVFDEYNVSFCSATEAFDTATPSGRMMLNILTSFAQFERERISERVTENMVFSAGEGKLQQPPCFGFDIALDESTQDKKFVVNKDEVEWAIKIFELFVNENYGYMKIAKYLNKNEVKTKKNGTWSAPGVKAFLQNELLLGKLIWNRRNTKGEKWKMRDESEWIITDNAHEQIIPLDLWYKVQYKISQNQPRGRQGSPHMLKGLIKCGHCGSSMVSSRIRGNNPRMVYMCSKYRQGQGCICNWIYMDEIEQGVIEHVEKVLLSEGEISVEKIEENKIDVTEINKQLESIKFKMDLQMQLLEQKEISLDEFRIARDRIGKEKDRLEQQLNIDTDSVKQIILNNNVLEFLKDSNKTREEKRGKLEKIIKRIVISKENKPYIVLKTTPTFI